MAKVPFPKTEASNKKRVCDATFGEVKTVPEDMPVVDVVKMMSKHKIGAAIVVNHLGHTSGIFTERDLMDKVVAVEKALTIPVSQVMTRNLVCVQLHDDLESVPALMLKGGFRHVPIVDGFKPVGILSIRDFLKK